MKIKEAKEKYKECWKEMDKHLQAVEVYFDKDCEVCIDDRHLKSAYNKAIKHNVRNKK